MTGRRSLTLASLGVATAFCVALVAFRVFWTRHGDYSFLVWNLILAWAPLVLALRVYDGRRLGHGPARLVALGVLWLLFFPNAPYIFTDFVHLYPRGDISRWFDLILLAAAAWTGLALGLVSLHLMQTVVRAALGARAGWAFALGALGLGSFGVYLGRFLRLNSWDPLVQPGAALARIALASPPKMVAVTLVLTGFLGAAYLVVYAFLDERVGE